MCAASLGDSTIRPSYSLPWRIEPKAAQLYPVICFYNCQCDDTRCCRYADQLGDLDFSTAITSPLLTTISLVLHCITRDQISARRPTRNAKNQKSGVDDCPSKATIGQYWRGFLRGMRKGDSAVMAARPTRNAK